MAPFDAATVTAQIESLFSRLHQELSGSDARQRCELAKAAMTELETLRKACRPGVDSSDTAALIAVVETALTKASFLYDTFHQELQYELEWASNGEG